MHFLTSFEKSKYVYIEKENCTRSDDRLTGKVISSSVSLNSTNQLTGILIILAQVFLNGSKETKALCSGYLSTVSELVDDGRI